MCVVLPCRNTLLRSRTTQRPSQRLQANQWLEPTVEKDIALLIAMEVDFLLRLEELKKDLHSLAGFNIRHLYKAIAQPNNQGID